MSSVSSWADATIRRIVEINHPIDLGEVLRYIGYPAGVTPGSAIAREIDLWVAEASAAAEPRATYIVLPVIEKTAQSLQLAAPGGPVNFHGAIGEFLGVADYIAVFIATAGRKIEALAAKLVEQGESLPAMIVSAVGAERAETAESEVARELQDACKPAGYALTLPYSPGYCGMKLTEQRALFDLFRGVDTGVTLTDSCLMRPLKSISGLIGIGPAEVVEEHGSPCDRCELHQCSMRRETPQT